MIKTILRRTILLTTICMLGACSSEMDFKVDNVHDNIIVMGHGGMGFFHRYPMNSFESIMNCIRLGADGTEIDVQLSRDNVLYAFHDGLLDDATNMTGAIRDKESETLNECFYDKQTNSEFRLARLDKTMEKLSAYPGLKFSFDCKLSPGMDNEEQYYSDFIDAIGKLIKEYHLQGHVYIESSNPDFLLMLRRKMPAAYRFYYASDFEDAINYLKNDRVQGITISGEKISAEQITQLHDMNIMVALFGAKSPSGNKDFVKRNADIIQSDYVKDLIDLIR
ncbi:MAG: glycerophosphodiester phosphodiesterase [Bacteroidales bacterium]